MTPEQKANKELFGDPNYQINVNDRDAAVFISLNKALNSRSSLVSYNEIVEKYRRIDTYAEQDGQGYSPDYHWG